MDLYNRWFEVEVEKELKNIKNPFERISFLYKKKKEFSSLECRGDLADPIFDRFDISIEEAKNQKDKAIFELSLSLNNDTKKEDKSHKEEQVNPHPRIFQNTKGFELFEYMKNNVREGKVIADFCFIYWKMTTDEFMHNIKPKEYKDWLFHTYSVDLGEHWKQLCRCRTDEKEHLYSMAKQQFRPQ